MMWIIWALHQYGTKLQRWEGELRAPDLPQPDQLLLFIWNLVK